MRKPKKIVLWRFAFLLILLILANSRFIGIETASLSPSEAAQFATANQPVSEIMAAFSFSTSQSSSLFTLFLHQWIALFGSAESALRTLPALFSLMSLFPFFGIARILFNKRISYGASALYAFSPLGAALAQELAPTSLFLLFSLISTWSLLMMIRRKAPLYKMLYLGAFIGALFTNPAAWYLLGFHSIYFLGSYFHHDAGELGFRNWLAIMAAIAVTASISFPEVLPKVESPFREHFALPFIGFSKLFFHFSGSVLLLIPVVIIAVNFLRNNRFYFKRFHFLHGRYLFVVLWFSMLAIPPYLFAFHSDELGRADGAAAALFPFLLLTALGIDMVAKNTHRHILYISLFSISALMVHLNTNHHDIPWKKIFSNADRGSGIIAVGEPLTHSIAYYGSDSAATRSLVISDSTLAQLSTQNEVKQFVRSYNTISLVAMNSSSPTLLKTYLANQYTIESDKIYPRPKWRTTTEPALQVVTYRRKAK